MNDSILKYYIVEKEDGTIDIVASTGKIKERILQEAPKDEFGNYAHDASLLKLNKGKYTIDKARFKEWSVRKLKREREALQAESRKIQQAAVCNQPHKFIAAYLEERDGNPGPMMEILRDYVKNKRARKSDG